MTKTAKATKAQLKTLKGIWTTPTAAATLWDHEGADGGVVSCLVDSKQAAAAGFAKLNGNSRASLLGKGFIRLLTVTKRYHTTVYGKPSTYRIQVAVLTDAGRAAIGV
jgi:hypothetical protein